MLYRFVEGQYAVLMFLECKVCVCVVHLEALWFAILTVIIKSKSMDFCSDVLLVNKTFQLYSCSMRASAERMS